MGIFDSLKNMTNQAVKNNVSKAVSGAVNNAMHKSKTFVFADYPKNADELKKMPELDFSSPLSTAAFAMLVLLEYDESPENTIEMLNVLKGPQPMNGIDVQFLRDRIKGRGYIPRSYFEGSSVKNDYTPNVPYKITVSEYAYTYQSEGYAKVQVQSSGADSPRPIELRRKGNQWFLWRNLALSDIRTPAFVHRITVRRQCASVLGCFTECLLQNGGGLGGLRRHYIGLGQGTLFAGQAVLACTDGHVPVAGKRLACGQREQSVHRCSAGGLFLSGGAVGRAERRHIRHLGN